MLRRLLTLPFLILYLLSLPLLAEANSEVEAAVQQEMVQVAGPEFWRQVRQGEIGDTASLSTKNGRLINVEGMYWQHFRNKWVSPLGLFFLGASAGGITLFYLLLGRVKLDKPRSGKKMLRWTPFERVMHWFTAISFLILAFSGVFIFYGRMFIKPYASQEFWGSFIYASKIAHNYIGPLFVLGLFMMLIKWMKNNWINSVDIRWFKEGGGLFGNGKHPDAGFCNAGEKVWFWLIATVGVVVCITGLIMDFPMFGQTRLDMQVSNLIHGLASLGLFAAALGHIYIGTLGTEGAFEGMATGYVDETWAEQHHNLWVAEVKQQEAGVGSAPSMTDNDAPINVQEPKQS